MSQEKPHQATYSPDDDKIRIYPAYRLPADEYQQLKAAGYAWAPKQECFYAVWRPSREKVALRFAEEIEDEDKSLVDRAEERADRFGTYSDNRAADAQRAKAGVAAIADNIPFGQPILVGHHSEKRARKDAEKIERGMRTAVRMWETSEYWTRRAAGALAHAKYKERPDVRARRIKGLEADKRKQEKNRAEAETALAFWSREDLTIELATKIAGYPGYGFHMARKEGDREDWSYTPTAYDALTNGHPTLYAPRTFEEVVETAKRVFPRTIAHCNVWLDHINNRLAYERAMLAEAGGLAADKFGIAVGGQVRSKWGWHVVTKINKKSGVMTSVSVADLSWTLKAEEIKDYKAPAEGDTEKVQAATKLPPMCNYKTDGCAVMTQAEYTQAHKAHKGSRVIAATDTHGAHRLRTVQGFIARRHGAEMKDQWWSALVFISDAKVTEAPKLTAPEPKREMPKVAPTIRPTYQRPEENPEAAEFQTMKDQLKQGVQVVAAPQLFPTPPEIAAQMVEYLEIEPGMTVLEPSAGTGNLVQAVRDAADTEVVGYEINGVALCGERSEDRHQQRGYTKFTHFQRENVK